MKKQTKLGLVLAAAAVISVSVASLVSARGWVQNGADWYYVDNNNEYVTDTIQASGNSKFYLGEDGAMMRDYFLEEYGDNNNAYYFGQNGAMVTNTWVAIESSRVGNQEDYIPDNYWYYFQASGKAMKAASGGIKKTTIDGKKYAFNEYGQMLTGWIDDSGKVINPDDNTNPFETATYYAGGDNDGVLRSGWVTYYDGYDGEGENGEGDYTNLYFYFNTSNNKKYGAGENSSITKKINGKTYAFTTEGIMLSGWDAWHSGINGGPTTNKPVYFSGEDDGHQVKKGWVYAVPAQEIDQGKYDDDEEVYMYFGASGDIVKDQFKKVNGKFYAFSDTGVMKTGVVVWRPEATGNLSKFVDTLDLDYAEGSDVSKKGILQIDDDEYIYVNANGTVIAAPAGKTLSTKVTAGQKLKLHLYGSDGARKTGANAVEFADDTYTLQTNGNAGDKGSGTFSKKYYSLGIQLKASSDIRYGIFMNASASDTRQPLKAQSGSYYDSLTAGDYLVLTTGGSKLKGNTNAKKDADGNYWLVSKSGDVLKGIWTVNANTGKDFQKTWKTRKLNANDWPAPAASISWAQLCDTYHLGINGAQETSLTQTSAGASIRWEPHFDNNGGLWFTPTEKITTYAYQSDYDGGANKWIPMGMTDDAGKSATLKYADFNLNSEARAYEVAPNNDYFLNCYWTD